MFIIKCIINNVLWKQRQTLSDPFQEKTPKAPAKPTVVVFDKANILLLLLLRARLLLIFLTYAYEQTLFNTERIIV